jgi:hypothetical protein
MRPNYESADYAISKDMQGYWTNLAKAGNPILGTSIYVKQATNSGDGSIGHALALLASNRNFYIMIGYENLCRAAILPRTTEVRRRNRAG